jgi:flagellar hook-associated protein 3 FlgL
MRISTAFGYDQSVSNLQKRQQDLSESQNQLTTGKRVNAASDDPTAAARAERALSGIARTEADQRSLEASRNVMNIAESALSDSVDLLQTARETLVAGGNGSYSASELKSLAVKLKEIRSQLLSVANRPDGGGGYVFGGQGSSSPPFADTPSGVVFQGQGGQIVASSNEQMSLTIDGGQTWLKANSGNGVFTTSPAASNQGDAWVTSGSVYSPTKVPYPDNSSSAPTFSLKFHVGPTGTTYDLVQSSGASSTTLQSGVPYEDGKTINITDSLGTVDTGMNVSVKGIPADGDSFVINQSHKDLSIFNSLDKTIAALESADSAGVVVQQSINTGLTEVDSVLSNIQSSRSAVGETLNRMDGIEGRNRTLKLAAQTEKSNAEDLDMTESISKFQNQQTGYQAALQSYAAIQKLSLFQYING